MIRLLKKTFKYVQRIFKSFKNDCHFSLKLAFFKLSGELFQKLHLQKISSYFWILKDEYVLRYLKKEFSSIISEKKSNIENGTYSVNAPIWVCWWTGEESAPPLVKRCIRSIRDNAANHPVHIIDQNNYGNYLNIPKEILNKVDSKQICIANFSDYLRVSLINNYGGFWIDATVFCTATISENYFSLPFFTCKSTETECGYISRMRWTSFILAGWENNVFFSYMNEMFTAYWIKHDTSIDYLLVDYLIELAYREIPYIRKLIDAVPINNTHRDALQEAMYKGIPAEELDTVLHDDTIFYKLSWRESFPESALDGKESIYRYFINI